MFILRLLWKDSKRFDKLPRHNFNIAFNLKC